MDKQSSTEIDPEIGARFSILFLSSMLSLSSAALAFTATFLSGEDLEGTHLLRVSWSLLFANIVSTLAMIHMMAVTWNFGTPKSRGFRHWYQALGTGVMFLSFPAGFFFLLLFAWCNV